ncbi:MAG: FtsW/RodA/SpoVE family cell cycle protein [Ruminococcus sp.]|nr:FtsW/RodA/SpoVE family cell cycle protein [Ruminococcus sp.]
MDEYTAGADTAETSVPNEGAGKQRVAQARKHVNFRLISAEIDKPFCLLILVLLVFGIVMMFSASYARALAIEGDGYYYVTRQIRAGIIGLGLMIAVSFLDYHFFQNTVIAYLVFAVTFVVTLITSFVGSSTADATRWLEIGSFQLQPSEFLKIAVIIVFAYIISVNFQSFNKWRYSTLPFALILGAVILVLMKQRHMSAVMLVAIIGVTMMFVSGMPKKHFFAFIALAAALGAGLVLYKIFIDKDFGYITDRIQSWQDPLSDPEDKTLQTYNSLIAIGSGGMFGLGFGESRQKYLYLPESQNDFVFSVVCEELGLIGALAVILLFVMFILRGFYIASRAKDRFGMMLATGITVQIGAQALLNIAVASNAFPNTGISLPFFSYGGTALLIQLAEMGILLSISRQSNTRK